ncbi:MAG: HEAT repeat domain-containing protein [Candidatus Wallbacteria bacterium]|nr:HEAT repeat domain-containing protein [Candidatus Wallbacteria bacterium]
MAVNLAKICADLGHPDPQIKTFALMSITRLSRQIVDAPAEIREIAARLRPLSSSDNPDVVFLARKAFNHIDQHFKECLVDVEPPAPPMPPPPAPEPASALRAEPDPAEAEAEPALPEPAAAPQAEAEPAAAAVPLPPEPVPAPVAPPEPPPAPAAAVEAPKDPSTLTREEILHWLPIAPHANYLASLLIQIASKGRLEDLAAVAPMLSHADDRVRANAVEVFERLADANHVEQLLPLMEDRNNRVRGNAVMALARFDHPGVEKTLSDMLASTAMSMRETAAFVLSRIEKPFVEALLLHCLADPYEGVRMRATRALARYPTRPAVVALKRMLNDLDINICEAAAESLRSLKTLLQTQRAAVPEPLTPEPPAPEPPRAAAVSKPAPAPAPRPPPPPPVAAPEPSPTPRPHPPKPAPPAGPATDALEELYRSLGTEIYQLCRLNLITHESLDSIFYEVLRYQDFLRNYMVKRGDPEDETRKSAIEHLQEKIKSSFGFLGRQAADLLHRQQLVVPEQQEGEAIRRILAELQKAGVPAPSA